MTDDLSSIFYEDYFGFKWRSSEESVRSITWSPTFDLIKVPGEGTSVVTGDISVYMPTIRQAFRLWDDAIPEINFVETTEGNSADITIAITHLPENAAYWNSAVDSSKHIAKSSIRFNDLEMLYTYKEYRLTLAMHEIGNVLGLGDIIPSDSIQSVQEDPIPEDFSGSALWDYDKQLIARIYPSAATTIATEATTTTIEKSGPIINVIKGTSGRDKLKGTSEADNIIGRGGADKIFGYAGDDLLDPGEWTDGKFDKVKGGAGSDTFIVQNGYYALVKDFNLVEDKLDTSGLSNGLIWDNSGNRTFIYGDDGEEVAILKGITNLSEANII